MSGVSIQDNRVPYSHPNYFKSTGPLNFIAMTRIIMGTGSTNTILKSITEQYFPNKIFQSTT